MCVCVCVCVCVRVCAHACVRACVHACIFHQQYPVALPIDYYHMFEMQNCLSLPWGLKPESPLLCSASFQVLELNIYDQNT